MPPGFLLGSFELNTTVSFITPVQNDIKEVEALMSAQADPYHPDLQSALNLIFSAGGKRIRPALTILTGKMLGANHDRLVILAAAIELLHTATLVHDDLIDGAFLRRGMPTLNSKWSPGATVLTGDFVFARAANMAAETNSVEVMKLFSRTLAIIVDGEIAQLFSNRCQADRENYHRRIYSKTASLFETSAKAAAMVGDADENILELMRVYGYNIGMAFQIIDDILDFTGEQATLGKPVGNDLRQGIITLPAIVYAEKYPQDADARNLINGECIQENSVQIRLIESIRASDAIQTSHQEACQHIETGLASLRQLPSSPERFALEDLANYIVQREL
jgi:geranylgeranyl pyrophosphate synthase